MLKSSCDIQLSKFSPLISNPYISQRDFPWNRARLDTQTQVRKRESIDIISEILSFVVDGVTAKTHLQQRSNLDSREMKHYVDIITQKGFLSSERDGHGHESYHLTERGRDFLHAYKTLEGFLNQGSNIVSDPHPRAFRLQETEIFQKGEHLSDLGDTDP